MIINITYETPSRNTYHFQITLSDGDNNTYTFLPEKLYPFQYGNDEKIDSILYPDNVKIKFSIHGAGIDVDSGYYTIINKFSFIDSSVIVTKNGSEMMRGYIDQMNVFGEYETKSAEITILGNFGNLKNIDPRTLDADVIRDSTPTIGFADSCAFFTKVITETVKLVIPNVTQTILQTDLKATTNYSVLGDPYNSPADNWGDLAYRFWGVGSSYGRDPEDASKFNCAQLIKNILAIFGCVGIVKDNKFIMQSRIYFPNNVSSLLKKNYLRSRQPEPVNQQKVDGLQMHVKDPEGLSFYEALYGIVKKDENGNLEEPDRVETIWFNIIGGDPPGIDGNIYPLLVRKLIVYIPGFVAGLGNEIWDYAKRNECYSSSHPTKGPVWKVVADSIWTDSSIDRLAYKVKSLGFDYEYQKFYQLEGDPNSYRPRLMAFDENEYSTDLDLIRLTALSQEFEPETDYSLRDSNDVLLYDTDDVALYSQISG
ncbi:hypothetical protein IT417_01555 [bacterium]|nr:hypothetical protein [bacterium]